MPKYTRAQINATCSKFLTWKAASAAHIRTAFQEYAAATHFTTEHDVVRSWLAFHAGWRSRQFFTEDV